MKAKSYQIGAIDEVPCAGGDEQRVGFGARPRDQRQAT